MHTVTPATTITTPAITTTSTTSTNLPRKRPRSSSWSAEGTDNGDEEEEDHYEGHASTPILNHKRVRRRPAIVSIEGIPGSGKSELLEALRERYCDTSDIAVISEPNEAWQNIKLNEKNLLDLFYMNRCEYGFAFQLLYFLAVERQLQRAITENAEKRVIICERSLIAAKEIYEDSLRGNYQNAIVSQVYDKLFEKEGVGYVYPDQMIILDKKPEECLGKISRLDWKGDEVITLDYLTNCRSAHKEIRGRSSSGGYLEFMGQVGWETMFESIDKLVEDQTRKELKDDYFDKEKPKPLIISIEGNVGAGKSTLIDAIQRRLTEDGITDIRIMKEPVDEWLSVRDSKHNILELYYNSPGRYAMPFQTLAAWTTMRNLYREHIAHPEAKVIICERSVLTSKLVFERMLFEEGNIDEAEHKVLEELYNDPNDKWMIPTQSIYLEAEPSVCLERIRERGREGEEKIKLGWLETCQEYHERLWDETGRLPKRVQSRETSNRLTRSDQVADILKWCRQVGGLPNDEVAEAGERIVVADDFAYVQLKLHTETVLKRLRTSEITYEGLVEISKTNFSGLFGRDVYFAWLSKGGAVDHVIDDSDLERAMKEQKRKSNRTIYRFEIISFEKEEKSSEEQPLL